MLDCGLHMGYQDERRYPDFSYISSQQQGTSPVDSATLDFSSIDCVLISHFHLDHCGALPYFVKLGYKGPIYMSHPTRAICGILLQDNRRINVERKGNQEIYSALDISHCIESSIGVYLNETVAVTPSIDIKAYYAGHVLGACMFHIRVRDMHGAETTVVYTGDYNMTPDRHLGSAWIDACAPDLLITECTYATMIRDSKRSRERKFLKIVHDCVQSGGKVLVPVFALGRAQELLILIDGYWDRMGLKTPVYFSAGMTERGNEYYKLFISWTNEHVKSSFYDTNLFDFPHIGTWDPARVDDDGPMVLFASPGMLHAGSSLAVFKKWCSNPKNMVVLPGYCVAGTVGARVLKGERTIQLDALSTIHVNLQVQSLSFSAHADAKGILALLRMSKCKNALLVHGEQSKMAQLKKRIEAEIHIPCYDPANGSTVVIHTTKTIPVWLERKGVTRGTLDYNNMHLTSSGILTRVCNRTHSLSQVVKLLSEFKTVTKGDLVYVLGKSAEPVSVHIGSAETTVAWTVMNSLDAYRILSILNTVSI